MIKYIGENNGTERWLRNGTYYQRSVLGRWEFETDESLVPVDDETCGMLGDERIDYLKALEAEKEEKEKFETQAALEADAEEKLQCWSVTHPDAFIEAILVIAEQRTFEILGRETIENPRGVTHICPPDTVMSARIKHKMAILANKRAERNKRDQG